MEFRVLEYFLAIAREGSFSKAAKQLHITQPTLSRQISDLEKEIGKVLFIRGKKQVSLTEDGVFLFNRAKEIVSLKDKTLIEFSKNDDNVYGDVYIGGGESLGMSLIAKTIKLTQDKYPNIRFHLFSGNAESVVEKLERGLIDFGILINSCVTDKYEHIKLGVCDQLGVLMRKDDVLANKNTISISDITNKPLIVSAQESLENIAKNNYEFNELTKKAICTYNLLYNASLLVREKVGYCICIDNIINTKGSDLIFKPLEPRIDVKLILVYKKYNIFSKAASIFLDLLKQEIENNKN
ncbi:MAG: LysR family transcriptional regulator [Firmicutes bacterium]|nr:LysR family transcriptional regulator [Candidatus Alectryobacillus merdavium]